MAYGKGRGKVYVAAIGAASAVVAAVVWAYALSESRWRGVAAEFEAYQALSALVESARWYPAILQEESDRLISFGLYDDSGKALVSRGEAPLEFDFSDLAGLARSTEFRRGSIVITRELGAMPMRGKGMQRPGKNPGVPPFPPPLPPDSVRAPSSPRYAYLEYSSSGLFTERFLLMGGAAAITAVLGLAVLALIRYRRANEAFSERELANRELVSLGEAARTLAHEIKNPLGVIKIQCATLRRSRPDSRAADVIEEEADRLSALADRVRGYLKPSDGKAEALDLVEYLESFTTRYRGKLALRRSTPLGAVVVDRGRLSDALDNLVRNALESQEAVGVEAPAEIEAQRHGAKVRIAVLDRGGGVPEADRSRLFRPFFSTKEKGSGIGLALAGKIAAEAGGSIDYAPRQGGGSVFSIWLPETKGR